MDVGPEDVVVAVNCLDDAVVQAIQLLKEGKLLLDIQQLRMLGHRESKELLPTSVGDVLPVQVVKSVLTEKTEAAVTLDLYEYD